MEESLLNVGKTYFDMLAEKYITYLGLNRGDGARFKFQELPPRDFYVKLTSREEIKERLRPLTTEEEKKINGREKQ
jgi:hypothetical protein